MADRSSIRHIQPSSSSGGGEYAPVPLATSTNGFTPPGTPLPDENSFSMPMQEFSSSGGVMPGPRFQGAALRADTPGIRDSVTSSNLGSGNGGGSLNSSVYALNPASAAAGGAAGAHILNDGAPYLSGGYRDDPNAPVNDEEGYYAAGHQDTSTNYFQDKRAMYASPAARSKRKVWLILGGLVGLAIIAVAVVVPVYFTVIKKDNNNSSKSSNSGGNGNGNGSGNGDSNGNGSGVRAITGGDGSVVTLENGTEFTYKNSFGGYWYFDPEDPFNNGARAQSWSPALNETFKYGIDSIRGVNLGGWLNTEPFMQVPVPSLYEPYTNGSIPAVDEWTLSQNLRADTANGGINQLEEHYKTFITEQDFAEIAAAGLNWVRIPLPYWAIEVRGDEPFLEKTCWTYFLKAVEWARKYGLRINLDLHTLPGSQNGWNHSGKLGTINMLKGPMGLANAQRSLDYIRIIAEFISQPQYRDVVAMFGIVNEPRAPEVGTSQLQSFYLEAYEIIRNAGGFGEGKGPMISYFEGLLGLQSWGGFLSGADRISLDSHPYLVFGDQGAGDVESYVNAPCTGWAEGFNKSMTDFGLTVGGEWSVATNDCGWYLNGVGFGTRYEGTFDGKARIGSCDDWLNWEGWSADRKQAYQELALTTMDALQNYFFWTWKIGHSKVWGGRIMTPHWSYKLGLENGWIPTDPRGSVGKCGATSVFEGPLQPSMTGGLTGATNAIGSDAKADLAWPPKTIVDGGAVDDLPKYTPTGTVATLGAPTFVFTKTSGGAKETETADAGDGWANSGDSDGAMVEIQGCVYLDPWVGPTASPPSPLCTSGAGASVVTTTAAVSTATTTATTATTATETD